MRYNHNGVISRIDELIGCSQVAVFNSSFVFNKSNRGKGHGISAHEERIIEAIRLGYDAAICTVVSTNTAEIAILKKFGWRQVAEFHSSKTDNNVQLWFIDLKNFNSVLAYDPNSLEYNQYKIWEKSLERVQ